jgi:predicted transcriptional regulator
MSDDESDAGRLGFAAEIVAAYVANNPIEQSQVPEFIRIVHSALGNLNAPPQSPQPPAVPIEKSIREDYIVCLEDGARLKLLKRRLRAKYGMSPDEYRAKWGLPHDYPMVAPGYAKRRSEHAKEIGLGRDSRPRSN